MVPGSCTSPCRWSAGRCRLLHWLDTAAASLSCPSSLSCSNYAVILKLQVTPKLRSVVQADPGAAGSPERAARDAMLREALQRRAAIDGAGPCHFDADVFLKCQVLRVMLYAEGLPPCQLYDGGSQQRSTGDVGLSYVTSPSCVQARWRIWVLPA